MTCFYIFITDGITASVFTTTESVSYYARGRPVQKKLPMGRKKTNPLPKIHKEVVKWYLYHPDVEDLIYGIKLENKIFVAPLHILAGELSTF